MFCTNCGKEMPEGKAFCPSCGAHVVGAASQAGTDQTGYAGQAGYTGGQMTSNDWNQAKYQATFVDPDEKYLGELGDGYFKGTLTSPFGVAKKCSAVVTDKRVYLQGKLIDASQGRFNMLSWVKTVGVKDITGTGFVASNPIGLLVASILFFLYSLIAFIICTDAYGDEEVIFISMGFMFLLVAVLFLVIYLVRRKAFFVIEYAGGRIQFDATAVGVERVRAFQHLVIRAKDAAER